jgi:hypothetical protein
LFQIKMSKPSDDSKQLLEHVSASSLSSTKTIV